MAGGLVTDGLQGAMDTRRARRRPSDTSPVRGVSEGSTGDSPTAGRNGHEGSGAASTEGACPTALRAVVR
jgi:hypothetical protein